MIPPFIRACRLHGEEIEAKYSASGRESLWCNGGGHHRRHRCRSWDVRDGNGEVLAIAFMNESPQITSPELAEVSLTVFMLPPPPRLPCKNGHLDWELKGETYRCGTCRRERAAKRHAEKPPVITPVPAKPKRRRTTAAERKAYALSLLAQAELNKRLRKEQRCRRTQ